MAKRRAQLRLASELARMRGEARYEEVAEAWRGGIYARRR